MDTPVPLDKSTPPSNPATTVTAIPNMNMATTSQAIATAAAAAAAKTDETDVVLPPLLTGTKRKLSDTEPDTKTDPLSSTTDPAAAAAAAAVAALAAGVANTQPKDPLFYNDGKKSFSVSSTIPILPAPTGAIALGPDGTHIIMGESTFEQPEKKIRKRRAERDNHSEMWMKQYELLKAYKEKHGHCLVPKIYPENQSFSTWVYKQRADYRQRQKNRHKGPMNDERLQKLNEIGFVFRAKSTKEQMEFERQRRQPSDDKKWDNFFDQLCAFKASHGHAIVPKVCKENQPLSRWVFKQRAEYKARTIGKPSRLTDLQIEKLNSVGFAWEAKTNDEWRKYDLLRKQVMVDGVWNHHFNELCEFKEKNGHTIVPKVYPANQTLSTWVYRQRALYRRREQGDEVNELVRERFKKLEGVGFKFRVRNRKSTGVTFSSTSLVSSPSATLEVTPETLVASPSTSASSSMPSQNYADDGQVETVTATSTNE